MLGNSAVVVVRTRPRAIPLAKITMRKSTHGFLLSFPCMMSMGLRLAALWAAGAPLKNAQEKSLFPNQKIIFIVWEHQHDCHVKMLHDTSACNGVIFTG